MSCILYGIQAEMKQMTLKHMVQFIDCSDALQLRFVSVRVTNITGPALCQQCSQTDEETRFSDQALSHV